MTIALTNILLLLSLFCIFPTTDAQNPSLGLISQTRGSKSSIEAQIPALQFKCQSSGTNPSLGLKFQLWTQIMASEF